MCVLFKKAGWQLLVIISASFFYNFNADGQGSVYSYSRYNSAGTSPESAMGIATDGNTNSYILGGFSSATTINGTTLNNDSGWPNIFLIKFIFGSTNAPQWAKAPATDYTISNAKVGSDFGGNSFVAGSFGGTNLTFGTTTITNYGNSGDHSEDIFLAKYDTSGNFILLTQAGGTSEDTLEDMVTDSSGNSYLTGVFQSSTFSAGTSNLVRQSTSGGDCFTLKYDSSGNVVWIKQGSYARGKCIAYDSANNCYVGGVVLGSAVFDGLSPSNQITTNFLAKYTSAGTLAWVRGNMSIGKYIKLDKAQNIYTAGTFSNVVQLGGITLTNNSAATIFVAKYDTNGNVLWAKQLSGLGDDNATGLAIDSRTNCWITGHFASVDSPTNTVAAVARFDRLGNLTGISQVSQTQPSTAGGIVMNGMTFPYGGNALICGSFATNFVLDGKLILTNGGNTDVFAAWVMVSPTLALNPIVTNVVCSWPVADSLGFILETNSDLSANWTGAGSGSLVNGQMVITNNISSGARFYRLRHP